MRVVVGSDHAGYALKTLCIGWLNDWGYDVEDVGAHSAIESVDYPEFGAKVAKRVVELGMQGPTRGVAICGSGIGISIAANKIAGARAALVSESVGARLCREHNDANVICLGERVIGTEIARDALRIFLTTAFEGGRHARRVAMLDVIERG